MNDFVNSPVPQEKSTSGWRIAFVKIGIVIALPAFLTGAELGSRLGFTDSAVAIALGCMILTCICSLTGLVAARSRLPTAVITQFAFGRSGARVVNLVLAITLIGWFAVTLELFADSLRLIAGSGSNSRYVIYVAAGGFLMVLTTVFGFKALTRLSNLAVPLLFAAIVAMAYYTSGNATVTTGPEIETLSLGLAISAVAGGPAAGTVIFPDIARFARSTAHSCGAAIISYGIGMPFVLLLVGMTAIATGEKDLILIMTSLGLGLPAAIFLVLVAWTTNAGNLYSGSLFLSAILRGLRHYILIVGGGVFGTVVASFGITDYFIPFLVGLSITVPPIAGIYVADFFMRKGRYEVNTLDAGLGVRFPALIGWAGGILAAFLSARGTITMTGIPACDSLLLSAALFFLVARLRLHKRTDRARSQRSIH